MNNCTQCDKWEYEKKRALESSESIFEAHDDIVEFEKQCIKTCPHLKNNLENS